MNMDHAGEGSACDPMRRMPVELTTEIFGHLTIFDKFRSMCVSKCWREHLLEPYLWKDTSLSDTTKTLALNHRETRVSTPWSQKPQFRRLDTHDTKIIYTAFAEDRSKKTSNSQLCRYLEKISDDFMSVFHLSSLHLVNCHLDRWMDSTTSISKSGFSLFANLRHLKLEACRNYFRGGLPSGLQTLLVYGECLGMAGDGLDNALNDWRCSNLRYLHTVDIIMPSLSSQDVRHIIRHSRANLRNFTHYCQPGYVVWHIFIDLPCPKLEKLRVYGGRYVNIKTMPDNPVQVLQSLKSFMLDSVVDVEDFDYVLETLRQMTTCLAQIENITLLDCPCSEDVRQRLVVDLQERGVKLKFQDTQHVRGSPYYARNPASLTSPTSHEDSLHKDSRLEEAVLGWKRWLT